MKTFTIQRNVYLFLLYAMALNVRFLRSMEDLDKQCQSEAPFHTHETHELDDCFDDRCECAEKAYIQLVTTRLALARPEPSEFAAAYKLIERHHMFTELPQEEPEQIICGDFLAAFQHISNAAFLPGNGFNQINPLACALCENIKKLETMPLSKIRYTILLNNTSGTLFVPCIIYTTMGQLVFICNQCNLRFLAQNKYIEHILMPHPQPIAHHHISSTRDITYYCTLCRKQFGEKEFWRHLEISHRV